MRGIGGVQREGVGPEKGRLSAVRAEKRTEEAKKSRFNAGKMTKKTYEKTWSFWRKVTKKHKNEQKRAQTRTK